MNSDIQSQFINYINEKKTHNPIYRDICDIIDNNLSDDCIQKVDDYVNKELNNLKDLKIEINLYSIIDEIENFLKILITVDIFKLLGLSDIVDKYILQILSFFKNINSMKTYKNKIIEFVSNNNIFFGFERYLLYECDDDFERFIIKIIAESTQLVRYEITKQKSTIYSGILLLSLTNINNKIIYLLKKKELEFLKKYFLSEFSIIQKNIINKIPSENTNYDILSKIYYKNEFNLWCEYNNFIYSQLIVVWILIEIYFKSSFFDNMLIHTYLLLIFYRSNKYVNEQKNIKKYSIIDGNIQNKNTDIFKNINIIKSENMSEIEATKIVDNIESLLLCMFENNIKIHKTINEFRSVFYNKNLYSKYFLNLFINYNEAIDLKLEILRKLIEISLENIEIFKVEQIENKFIYDTFLKYEDNNQIMNVNLYSDSEILYKLENLSFAYYNNYIIKDVNCIIPKNKWISLYGNSGCGKTTFINLLIKNIEPLTGTISYMGVYPMFTYESIKKDISYVTSIPELFDESILYNITYSLKNPKSEEVINTINKYMILFKLDKYKENLDTTNIKFLSTGEKQRLQIIRLILIDKPIWLLDELTSNINNELEIIILEELKRIQVKKNKSVIHITHNLENLEFCDYKMYIKHSSIYIA